MILPEGVLASTSLVPEQSERSTYEDVNWVIKGLSAFPLLFSGSILTQDK